MSDDFLKEVEDDTKINLPDEERLSRLTALARQQLEIQEEIERLQQTTAARQAALNQISEKEIPSLMFEIGAREITLMDGHKLKIAPFYSGKITSEECYDWLEENGYGEIVKVTMAIKCKISDEKLIQKVRTILHDADIDHEEEQGVHSSTLKAWIKDTIQSGKPIDRDLFAVYTGWKTTIK